MRAHVWEMGLSLTLSSLVPWRPGDRLDRGSEGSCVGNRATLGTKGPDGQRE